MIRDNKHGKKWYRSTIHLHDSIEQVTRKTTIPEGTLSMKVILLS